MKNAISRMLAAIKVECMDEFDRNFDTESFFSRAWQRRKSPTGARYKTLHGPQATLRRSLVASVKGGGVEFRTDLPYAALHNQGGEIKVTTRMKRYFWYQHIRASEGMWRKKNGQLRHTQKNRQLELRVTSYELRITNFEL